MPAIHTHLAAFPFRDTALADPKASRRVHLTVAVQPAQNLQKTSVYRFSKHFSVYQLTPHPFRNFVSADVSRGLALFPRRGVDVVVLGWTINPREPRPPERCKMPNFKNDSIRSATKRSRPSGVEPASGHACNWRAHRGASEATKPVRSAWRRMTPSSSASVASSVLRCSIVGKYFSSS